MEQEGNFFTRKVGPFPAWVWLAGAALLAYLYFRHTQGAGGGIAGSPTTTGGGGTITTGNTRVDKGAVTVTVNADKGIGNDDKDTDPDHHKHQHQPGHHHHKREKQEWRTLTVPETMTLEQFADTRHWSPDTLKDVETSVQPKDSTFAGKKLKGTQRLKKGDKIARPQFGD